MNRESFNPRLTIVFTFIIGPRGGIFTAAPKYLDLHFITLVAGFEYREREGGGDSLIMLASWTPNLVNFLPLEGTVDFPPHCQRVEGKTLITSIRNLLEHES